MQYRYQNVKLALTPFNRNLHYKSQLGSEALLVSGFAALTPLASSKTPLPVKQYTTIVLRYTAPRETQYVCMPYRIHEMRSRPKEYDE